MSTSLTKVSDDLETKPSPMTGQIIEFKSPEVAAGSSSNHGESNQGVSLTGVPDARGWYIASSAPPVPARAISISALYQAQEARSVGFTRALELLGQATEALSEARDAIQTGDRIAMASEMMTFEGLLSPLFECRQIGEGFANIINVIHLGAANLQGAPYSEEQVNTLWRVIRALSVGPFVSFSDSLVTVRELEKVGLSFKSAFFDEWVSETSTVGKEQSIR
jgi:hypothetical protein